MCTLSEADEEDMTAYNKTKILDGAMRTLWNEGFCKKAIDDEQDEKGTDRFVNIVEIYKVLECIIHPFLKAITLISLWDVGRSM